MQRVTPLGLVLLYKYCPLTWDNIHEINFIIYQLLLFIVLLLSLLLLFLLLLSLLLLFYFQKQILLLCEENDTCFIF